MEADLPKTTCVLERVLILLALSALTVYFHALRQADVTGESDTDGIVLGRRYRMQHTRRV